MTWATAYMLALVLGFATSTMLAYLSGTESRPLSQWVYSPGFATVLVSEAGAVLLSFEWSVWAYDSRWTWYGGIAVTIVVFVIIIGVPMLAYDSGRNEAHEEQERKQREAMLAPTRQR